MFEYVGTGKGLMSGFNWKLRLLCVTAENIKFWFILPMLIVTWKGSHLPDTRIMKLIMF
jgi:hypothetical protein